MLGLSSVPKLSEEISLVAHIARKYLSANVTSASSRVCLFKSRFYLEQISQEDDSQDLHLPLHSEVSRVAAYNSTLAQWDTLGLRHAGV